jgi:enamine deaminase RidA (YjgF/YER057c/UK114 family)
VTFQVIDPESLGAPRGWSHGMLASAGGRVLFVAGQTAQDASGRVPAGPVADQWARALERILEVVRTAGGRPEDIGRLTIYVTDLAEYLANRKSIGEAYRGVMGRHYPAMALVEVAGLMDEGASVEIEATAVIPERSGA